MTTTPKFPECLYLGEFESNQHGSLPAYFPTGKGGFCLHYRAGEELAAHRQIENSVLCLLEDMPANSLQVHIIDFALRPNFAFLAQLKNPPIYHLYANEHAASQAFNQVEQLIQHRYHNLFSGSDSHLDHYNARAKRSEHYVVFIINTAYFPSNFSAQRLQGLLQATYGAGVYLIALHNCSQTVETHQTALKLLLDTLPAIQIEETQRKLVCDEQILPVKKLAEFGFRFLPADLNQSHIIDQLQIASQTTSGHSESDFIHIKIGTLANGDDAFLSLGAKSENYCAMLLGIPGSGKSTLMNNIIMQIGKQYHASQIRLYLMDLGGVEFNQFKDHPNVEKIFLEANAQNEGLVLLESLRPNVEARRQLFKSKNLRDIDEYNREYPDFALPRIIVMIDEFHRLFRGENSHRRRVNMVLEDIIREWRKFGVYLFLCTQTLQDVDLDKSLKDQIGLRISYRVNHESALGFGIFDSRYHQTVLGLQKYEALFQVRQNEAYSAYIDRPLNIEDNITQLRLTRPAHLQVKAEVVNPSNIILVTEPVSVTKTNNTATQTEVKEHSALSRLKELQNRTQQLHQPIND